MNSRLSGGLAVVLTLLTATVGCAQTGATVRGQNPDPGYGPLIGSAPGYGEIKYVPKKPKLINHHSDFRTYPNIYNNNFGYEGGYYAGPEGYYTSYDKRAYTWNNGGGDMGGGDCPHCQNGAACPPGGCQHCMGKSCPKHYHTYSYQWPQNMVYPPAVVPAGFVQYPYYTLRGPTDFFYYPINSERK